MFEHLRKHKDESFLSYLTFILWICILIPFCIIIISYSISLANTKKQNIESTYQTNLSNFCLNFDKILASANNKLDFIFSYHPLSQILNTKEKQDILQNISESQDIGLAFDAITSDSYSIELKIYSDNDNIYMPEYFYPISDLKEMSYFDNIDNLEKANIYYKLQNAGEKKLYIYRKYNVANHGYAVIELGIPCSQITKLLDSVNLSDTSCFYELDGTVYDIKTWNTVADFSANMSFKQEIHENNSTVYLSIPQNTYTAVYVGILLTSLIVLTATLVGLFLLTRLVAWILTKKLYEVVDIIKEDKIRDLDTDKIQRDEFGIIILKLSEYQKELKRKAEQENEYIKKMAKLEINILQERISPHFLYNTLASIKWIYRDPRLGNLIDSIVNYYRIMLNSGSSVTTIGNELSGIKEYLKIQSFAYAREFETVINCEEGLEKHHVLKNILQPIVENAFLHGLNLSDEYGRITISVFKENDSIVFRVINTGQPITADKMNEINSFSGVAVAEGTRHGYALKNIVNRLHLYYGESCGVSASLTEGLTTFSITIPFETAINPQKITEGNK